MSKLKMVAFVAAGYVLGARAGRERYDQIADRATKIWKSPKVQQGVSDAEQAAKDVAKDAAPKIQQKVAEAAAKIRPTESSPKKSSTNEASRSVTIADFDTASDGA